jgi:hypothetical protein
LRWVLQEKPYKRRDRSCIDVPRYSRNGGPVYPPGKSTRAALAMIGRSPTVSGKNFLSIQM